MIDPYLTDWLDLALRWLHVIAGIAWVGSSFYFIALDNHLLPPRDRGAAEEGVGGESWEIHGGGFYHVQKYRVSPGALPEPLHWFKWEAYTTWLSGFALMIVLFYANADLNLIDKSVADLSQAEAIGISIGFLAAAWVVYDVLCRTVRSEQLLGACVLGFAAVAAYGAGELFSARAVYVQVGAMLGTMMAGNVLFVIIPGQRELVAARKAGREPAPAPGIRGKQRSVHNNYLTLPVVFTMISGHFPMTYGHTRAWLILVAIMLAGAWIRHFFNLRHKGKTVWAIPVTAGAALALIGVLIRPQAAPKRAVGRAVPFAAVQRIVDARCVTCHSNSPTQPGFTAPPRGIAFDTPEQIRAQASAIEQVAVVSKLMPLGNLTGMTQAERDLLGRWIRQGARIR